MQITFVSKVNPLQILFRSHILVTRLKRIHIGIGNVYPTTRHLYSLERSYVADQICDTQITHYILNDSGIIEIPKGCYLRVKDTILYPEQFESTYAQQSYVSSLNLPSSEFDPHPEISILSPFEFNKNLTKK